MTVRVWRQPMSLPKILLAGALATLLGLALTWALNVNITKWVGL